VTDVEAAHAGVIVNVALVARPDRRAARHRAAELYSTADLRATVGLARQRHRAVELLPPVTVVGSRERVRRTSGH